MGSIGVSVGGIAGCRVLPCLPPSPFVQVKAGWMLFYPPRLALYTKETRCFRNLGLGSAIFAKNSVSELDSVRSIGRKNAIASLSLGSIENSIS